MVCKVRIASIVLLLMSVTAVRVNAQQKKPNILVILGDDIGYWNISAYNQGMMGFKTPNIDRIARRRRTLHRLLRPTELHRGSRRIHHRTIAHSHRPDQSGPARCRPGHPPRGSHACGITKAARLR